MSLYRKVATKIAQRKTRKFMGSGLAGIYLISATGTVSIVLWRQRF